MALTLVSQPHQVLHQVPHHLLHQIQPQQPHGIFVVIVAVQLTVLTVLVIAIQPQLNQIQLQQFQNQPQLYVQAPKRAVVHVMFLAVIVVIFVNLTAIPQQLLLHFQPQLQLYAGICVAIVVVLATVQIVLLAAVQQQQFLHQPQYQINLMEC